MGWRNIVLSCLAAQAALDRAHDEATKPEQRKGRPCAFDLVLRAVEVQDAMNRLIAEVTESCAPFGETEEGPSRLVVDRERLQGLASRLGEEYRPTEIVTDVKCELQDMVDRIPPGTGTVR